MSPNRWHTVTFRALCLSGVPFPVVPASAIYPYPLVKLPLREFTAKRWVTKCRYPSRLSCCESRARRKPHLREWKARRLCQLPFQTSWTIPVPCRNGKKRAFPRKPDLIPVKEKRGECLPEAKNKLPETRKYRRTGAKYPSNLKSVTPRKALLSITYCAIYRI
jgi:hypothetical protein